MPNYANGKIYMIWSKSGNLKYYGSTSQSLSARMSGHRKAYKRYKNGKRRKYISSFKVLENDDAKIELVELCPCESRSELERREGQIIREHECVNLLIAGRTTKEYRKDNRSSILQKQKNQESSIRIKCPCGGRYRDRNCDRTKHFNSNRHKKYLLTLDGQESH